MKTIKVFQPKTKEGKHKLVGTVKRKVYSKSVGLFGGDCEPGMYIKDAVMIEPGPVCDDEYNVILHKGSMYLPYGWQLPRDLKVKK